MKTTVFAGPSLTAREVAAILPEAHILPSAKRGDVYRARETGSTRILVIDGFFTQVLPISPRR